MARVEMVGFTMVFFSFFSFLSALKCHPNQGIFSSSSFSIVEASLQTRHVEKTNCHLLLLPLLLFYGWEEEEESGLKFTPGRSVQFFEKMSSLVSAERKWDAAKHQRVYIYFISHPAGGMKTKKITHW